MPYSLAYFGKPLIEDNFEAWVHDPVCRRLYDNLKDKSKLYSDVAYTSDGIDVDKEFNSLTFDQQTLFNIKYLLGDIIIGKIKSQSISGFCLV